VYTITAANADVGLLTAMLITKISDGSFATALQSSGFTSATASAAPTIVDESPSSRLDMITYRNHYLLIKILDIIYIFCSLQAFVLNPYLTYCIPLLSLSSSHLPPVLQLLQSHKHRA
jgi:hypothetical protein